MSKHTPEPWKKSEKANGNWWHIGAGNQAIAAVHAASKKRNEPYASMFEENARRIVACVNACKGLDTDELERNGLVSAVGYELIELTKQRDELLEVLATVQRDRDSLIQQLKQTSDSLNNDIVTMQAAVIDAKQNGPEAGMQWITNTLWGPGLIPDESEPWANNAQHYYSHNCSYPLGPCGVCGAPSSVAGAGHVACCMEHHKQLKGGAAGEEASGTKLGGE